MEYPVKKRELHNHHFDSTVWNDFVFRPDDIVLATYGKSGTTWAQQIIGQLIFKGAEGINIPELSPWLDLRFPPKHVKYESLEAQTNRRFIKTHLPVDALVFKPEVKYVFVGRDGRDVLWSFYHHNKNGNEDFYDALNNTPGRVGPPMEPPSDDIVEYYHEWLDRDGYPLWSFWDNIRSWWEIRHLPNVYFMHFANMKADLEKEVRNLAAYLEIELDEETFQKVVKHSSFDYMKKNAALSAPLGGALWIGGAKTFINKGTNGRWRDVLSEADKQKYEDMAVEKLGEECAYWLKTGELPEK